MPETYKPGKHDLAVTRYALSRAFSVDTDLGIDSLEDLSRSLVEAERDIHFGPLTRAQAATAKAVINYLANNKGLQEIAALNASQAIDKLTIKGTNVPEKADALKIPIEQVAEFTRLELQNIIQEESGNNLLQSINLTALERAVLNLNIMNAWADEKTWLKDYLSRTRKRIRVWPHRDRFVLSVNEIHFGSFGLTVHNVGLYLETKASDLQEAWDTSYGKTNVLNLANIDRVKAAEKILRNIK